MKWGLSIVSSQRVLNSTLQSCSQTGIRDPWNLDFIERFAHLPWKSTLLTESHIIPTSFGFHSGNKVRDRHIWKSSLSMISKQAALGNLSRSLHWECAVPTRVSRWEILIYSFLFISVCSGFYSRAQPFFFVVHLKGMNLHFHYRNLFQVFKMPRGKRNTPWGGKSSLRLSEKNLFGNL